MHSEEKSLSAVRRRLHYLRQEIYDYERHYRNVEGPDSTHLRDLVEDSRSEEAELSFLIELYESQHMRRRDVPSWMLLTVTVVAALSLVLAAVALWS